MPIWFRRYRPEGDPRTNSDERNPLPLLRGYSGLAGSCRLVGISHLGPTRWRAGGSGERAGSGDRLSRTSHAARSV